MAPVPWHSLDPTRSEKFISIMILRDNPKGRRRQPSSGDRGVDVLVPVPDDPSRFDVYQIKYFYQRLSSSQRNQISNSAATLLRAVREGKISVREWHLVLPLDPTEGDEEWLTGLFEGTEIATFWKGESHLEGWAAKYSDVVDYYINDGHERTRELMSRVLTLAEFNSDERGAVSVDSAIEIMNALRERLNGLEPHYRFEILTGVETDRMASIQNCPPNAAMRSCAGLPGGHMICIDVYPRYDEAYNDHPIEGFINVTIPNSRSDLVHALERFREFGEPLTIPSGFVETLTNDPLHGLQYSDSLNIRFEPITSDPPVRVRLLIRDQHSETVATLPVTVQRFTTGELGGMVAELVSDSGVFRLRQEVAGSNNPDRKTEFNLSLSWADQIASAALPDIRFGESIKAGRSLAMASEHAGPIAHFTTFEQGVRLAPDWLLPYCEALALIQDYAEHPLRLRIPEDQSASYINEAFAAANFLKGARRTTRAGRILFKTDDIAATVDQINQSNELLAGGPYGGSVAGVQVSFTDAIYTAQNVKAEVARVSGVDHVMVTDLNEQEFSIVMQREKYINFQE